MSTKPKGHTSFKLFMDNVKVKIGGTEKAFSSAYIFSSEPTRCPLCKADVPANTAHECRNPKG